MTNIVQASSINKFSHIWLNSQLLISCFSPKRQFYIHMVNRLASNPSFTTHLPCNSEIQHLKQTVLGLMYYYQLTRIAIQVLFSSVILLD